MSEEDKLGSALAMLGFWMDKKGVHDALGRFFEGPEDFEQKEGVTLPPEIRTAWARYLESSAALLALVDLGGEGH